MVFLTELDIEWLEVDPGRGGLASEVTLPLILRDRVLEGPQLVHTRPHKREITRTGYKPNISTHTLAPLYWVWSSVFCPFSD